MASFLIRFEADSKRMLMRTEEGTSIEKATLLQKLFSDTLYHQFAGGVCACGRAGV